MTEHFMKYINWDINGKAWEGVESKRRCITRQDGNSNCSYMRRKEFALHCASRTAVFTRVLNV
jgi:hypothetical protein